jgi:hypothetical protein
MPPRIERYSFGKITIDGETYRADVIVLPERVIPDWWRRAGHSLAMDDLRDVIARRPRVLVVGTGDTGAVDIPDETRLALEGRGIELIAEPTAQAVETYNRLSPSGDVAAGFHLTC